MSLYYVDVYVRHEFNNISINCYIQLLSLGFNRRQAFISGNNTSTRDDKEIMDNYMYVFAVFIQGVTLGYGK